MRKEKAATEWKTLSKINIFDRRERGTMSILFQAGISSMESHKSLGRNKGGNCYDDVTLWLPKTAENTNDK